MKRMVDKKELDEYVLIRGTMDQENEDSPYYMRFESPIPIDYSVPMEIYLYSIDYANLGGFLHVATMILYWHYIENDDKMDWVLAIQGTDGGAVSFSNLYNAASNDLREFGLHSNGTIIDIKNLTDYIPDNTITLDNDDIILYLKTKRRDPKIPLADVSK